MSTPLYRERESSKSDDLDDRYLEIWLTAMGLNQSPIMDQACT